jgi:hypothetical protein
MRSLTSVLPVILALPTLGCAKATFVALPDADGTTDTLESPPPPPDAAGGAPGPEVEPTCPAPTISFCSTESTNPCDPVCQVGNCNWCKEKCTYTYAADGSGPKPACAPTGDTSVPIGCQVTGSGSAQQADNCAPGGICLPGVLGDGFHFCFTLCRTSVDCLGSVACAPRPLSPAGGTVKVCDPPYDQCGVDGHCCDPFDETSCGANRYCFLVAYDAGSGNSRTTCEFSYGDGRNGSPCSTARDCQPRNVCVEGACLAVCDTSHSCSPGTTCYLYGSEYGYCQ